MRKGRRARVASLKAIQTPAQIPSQSRGIDIKVPQDVCDITVHLLDQPQQKVLEIHVMVTSADTHRNRRFQRAATRVVEPRDQGA